MTGWFDVDGWPNAVSRQFAYIASSVAVKILPIFAHVRINQFWVGQTGNDVLPRQ